MKAYWGSGGTALRIDIGTRLRWVVSFTPRSLYPRRKSPRAGLHAVVKRKIPSPCRDSNPRSSCPYPGSTWHFLWHHDTVTVASCVELL